MNCQGFDDYIYIVRVWDDGQIIEYEFGNLKHALELYLSEPNAQLVGYQNGEENLFELE